MREDGEIEVLDVGCGCNPRGDVNVDRYLYSPEVDQKSTKRTGADVIAVGEMLPFRDDAFKKVISWHTIEHSEKPHIFLLECIRVSKKSVEIVCPHRFSVAAKMPYHRVFLTKKFFSQVLSIVSKKIPLKYWVEIRWRPWMPLPSPLALVRPYEIHVRIEKI